MTTSDPKEPLELEALLSNSCVGKVGMRGLALSLFAAIAVIIRPAAAHADSHRPVTAYSEIQVIGQMVEQFRKDHGELPTQLEDLVSKRYLDRLVVDPWGHEYGYSRTPPYSLSINRDFYIWSFGSDGNAGGDGPAADIGNWQRDPPYCNAWWKIW